MKMKNKRGERLKRYLSLEVAIEYKACLYFFCIMFFYCVYLMCNQIYLAHVVHMFEMILTAYCMGYIQVYLFGNFDEAEKISRRNGLYTVFCTCLYGASSYLMNWFGRSPGATLLFLIYMALIYLCVYLGNKIKRIVDTEHLNQMLTEFKKGDSCV